MNTVRRNINVALLVNGLVLCLGFGIGIQSTNAGEPVSDSSHSTDSAQESDEGALTFDGSDEEAFDASWRELSAGLEQRERLDLNFVVMAAVFGELQPQDSGEAIDTAKMLEALDGKTVEQVYGMAQAVVGEEMDLEEMSLDEVRQGYEEFGLEVEDDISVTAIIDVVESEFAPDQAEQPEQQAGPYERSMAVIGALTQRIETYYVNQGELPENLEAMTGGDAPLMDEVPKDPWGHDYIYEVRGEREFRIISKGPDGERGTNQDLVYDY